MKEIAADLKVSRRASGLSNQDLAHLLGVDAARISRLENGRTELTLREAGALSLIYGKRIDGLLDATIASVAEALIEKLVNMPSEPEYWKASKERNETLNALAHTLAGLTLPIYEA